MSRVSLTACSLGSPPPPQSPAQMGLPGLLGPVFPGGVGAGPGGGRAKPGSRESGALLFLSVLCSYQFHVPVT